MKLASAARPGVRRCESDSAPSGLVVSMPLMILLFLLSVVVRSADESAEVTGHAFGIGGDAGDQGECLGGLMHGHVAAVADAASRRECRMEQLGVQRPVDDVGHPEAGVQQLG